NWRSRLEFLADELAAAQVDKQIDIRQADEWRGNSESLVSGRRKRFLLCIAFHVADVSLENNS
ncbi:hypothetical protein BgiBS90_020946, partial [Biomphalaria glabrata]